MRIPALLLVILAACFSGCVGGFTQFAQTDTSNPLINYALAENGARVVASSATSGHEPETAINGITSSDNWAKGEGWEAEFEREHLNRGYIRLEDRVRKEEHGGAWLEVHFPEPKQINKVIVHTLSPSSKYGIHEAGLQAYLDHGWMTLGLIKNGQVEYPTKSVRYSAGNPIEFRFSPTTTDKVRFVVYRSNDRKVVGKESVFSDRGGGNVYGGLGVAVVREKSIARVVEIEITGFEFAAAVASPTDTDELANPEANDEIDVVDEIFGENAPTTAPVNDVSAQIESVVYAYATAYANRDLSALMATVSENYRRDGEDYAQFQSRMQSVFAQYASIDLALQRVRSHHEGATATVEADYAMTLTSGDGTPAELSGKLFFSLVQVGDRWQIVRIDTQR